MHLENFSWGVGVEGGGGVGGGGLVSVGHLSLPGGVQATFSIILLYKFKKFDFSFFRGDPKPSSRFTHEADSKTSEHVLYVKTSEL